MPESPRSRRIKWAVWFALALAALAAGAWLGERSWRARLEFQAAQDAFDRGDLDEAQAHLDRCQRVWNEEPKVLLLAARIARRAGDPAKADENLKAYQRSPEHSDDLAILERLLMRAQSGTLSPEQENYLRLIADKEGTDAALIYEALAQGAMLHYRLNDAVDNYSRYLDYKPNDENALFQRGGLRLRMEQTEDAAADFERMLRLRSERDDVRILLGQVLLKQGKTQVEAATRHFELLFQRQPDNPEVVAGLAQCRLLAEQDKEAASLLDAALERNPGEGILLLPSAQLALDHGDAARAEGLARRLLHQAPLHHQANLLLLRCLEAQAKKAEAKDCIRALRDIETENRRLAGMMQQLHLRPADANLRYEIARMLLRMGEDREAEQWLKTALRLDPNHQPTQLALAEYKSRKLGTARPSDGSRRPQMDGR